MNVYDFDKTIYSGDSTADFYLYSLKKHPKIIKCLPGLAKAFASYYIFKKGNKTRFKEKMYGFLKYCDIKNDVEDFWDKKQHKIKKWYLSKQKYDDIIISASPSFLLEPICKRLGIKYLIASEVDGNSGKYSGINCHGEEKVRRFYEKFPDGKIDCFYSDSLSDTPLAIISEKSYIVKGETCTNWKQNKIKR